MTDAHIVLAEMQHVLGFISVRSFSKVELSPGVVDHGLIKDTDECVRQLQRCFDEASRAIEDRSVFIAMPTSKVFTHVFSFPRELSDEHIQQAVAEQFTEYFPFELADAAYDWRSIEQTEQTQMVIVAACEKKFVEQYITLCERARMSIQAIDVKSQCIARAILPIPQKFDAYALVDLAGRVTSVSIFDSQGLQLTYAINHGADKLFELVAAQTGTDIETAADMLFHTCFFPRKNKKELSLTKNIEQHFYPIIEEVKRNISFFDHSRKGQVNSVTLSGLLSQTKGIDAYLSERVGMPVQCGNPLARVRYPKEISEPRIAMMYAAAIGLGLGALDRAHAQTRFNFLKHFAAATTAD